MTHFASGSVERLLASFSRQVLQAGMCFHFQSGVWLDDFGAAISEPVIVTDRGGERLSDVARELVVV